jgi:hypothetical protein
VETNEKEGGLKYQNGDKMMKLVECIAWPGEFLRFAARAT